MARFPESFVQQVAQATDIVDLVGQYVALKKRGREFVGLCPFHNDKHPSMTVAPHKQFFKCFACGAGGGVFQFLMLHEKYEFPEAVRVLAERANIPLPRLADSFEPRAEGAFVKQDLLKATAFAAEFFQQQLRTPLGRGALEYAHKRGITDASIERFGLGYAPDGWDGLAKAAAKRRLSEELLLAAGLVARREEKRSCYDRFRNRLMFPIHDQAGAIIAFGGRALSADDPAKYLNSPESLLFDKSANLYMMNFAARAIDAAGQAVVVEGYLDALIPHQAGVENVVATLGTALTERHVRLLSRWAKEAVLIFDADEAGAKAAERGLEVFLAQAIHVRVATIPAGKDPCDYCLSDGPEALRALIDSAPDALHYLWLLRQEQVLAAGTNLAERRRVMEEFLRVVASSAAYGAIDDIRKGQLAQHIAHLVNVPADELQQLMRRLSRQVRHAVAPSAPAAGPRPEQPAGGDLTDLAERQVLEVLLAEPDLFDEAAERIAPSDFANPTFRRIAQAIWDIAHAGPFSFESLMVREELAPLAGLLAGLAHSGGARGNYHDTLRQAAGVLHYRSDRLAAQDLRTAGTDDALREYQNKCKASDVRRRPRVP
ncbi:MAG: DNA primase [Planctomycetota bacterium]|nr:DNA primase [Planctomycetota bacterium]